jgi:hypothetical protein
MCPPRHGLDYGTWIRSLIMIPKRVPLSYEFLGRDIRPRARHDRAGHRRFSMARCEFLFVLRSVQPWQDRN